MATNIPSHWFAKTDNKITRTKTETLFVIEYKRYSRPSEKPLIRTYKTFKEASEDYKTVKNNGNTFNRKFYKIEKTYYK